MTGIWNKSDWTWLAHCVLDAIIIRTNNNPNNHAHPSTNHSRARRISFLSAPLNSPSNPPKFDSLSNHTKQKINKKIKNKPKETQKHKRIFIPPPTAFIFTLSYPTLILSYHLQLVQAFSPSPSSIYSPSSSLPLSSLSQPYPALRHDSFYRYYRSQSPRTRPGSSRPNATTFSTAISSYSSQPREASAELLRHTQQKVPAD